MSKSKYDPKEFPRLAAWYARDGLTDEEIAKRLGIHVSTLYDYQNKYPDFADALKRTKAKVDQEVVDSLYKRAIGYKYEERRVIGKHDKDGTFKPEKVEIIEKFMPPSEVACIFWLKNRQRQDWKDKPTDIPDVGKSFEEYTAALTATAEQVWNGVQAPGTEPDEPAEGEEANG